MNTDQYLTCVPFENCTGSHFHPNWTDSDSCQPKVVRDVRELMLTSTGLVCFIGITVNTLTLMTFLYLHIFHDRIKKRFGQDFTMIRDPLVVLLAHLCFCDLLYCFIGLPSYWLVYYYGYWPGSHQSCSYIAFTRDLIAYVDFSTLAATAACIAWNNLRRRKKITRRRTVLLLLAAIWLFWSCITALPLLGVLGTFGYDPIHGKCHLIECKDWMWPPGAIMNTIGVGLPFAVLIISYSAMLRKYGNLNDSRTKEIVKSLIILTLCYFIFILPIYLLELIPLEAHLNKELIGVCTYSWYWLVYMIDAFVYVLYWPRYREALWMMMKDILTPVSRLLPERATSVSLTEYGRDFDARIVRSLSSVTEDNL